MTRWRRWWRLLLVLLLIRRVTPGPYERPPGPYDGTEDGEDTGGSGWYRPPWRRQDPSADPAEPGGGESSSAGNDHGWANCTMASGAMALAFHTLGDVDKWGGHLRHRQGDLSGGTDLYDLRDAWAEYGETLTIRSGRGWSGVQDDRDDGRAIVIQGTGNVPGSSTFDGGHACVISPERRSDASWLFGDPLAGGWQWLSESSIRKWAEAWDSNISYAISAPHKPSTPPPEPVPEPEPPPPAPEPGYNAGPALEDAYQVGVAEALDAVFASWRPGTAWPPDLEDHPWDASLWDWTPWPAPWPYPLRLLQAAQVPAAWGDAWWTGATWRQADDPEPEPPPDGVPWDLATWAVPWT